MQRAIVKLRNYIFKPSSTVAYQLANYMSIVLYCHDDTHHLKMD